MQHIVKNNELQVTCNVKLLENVQASQGVFLSGGGCCTVALAKHLNAFITPESFVKNGCATIIVADNANESGSKMYQIPITGKKMIGFLDSDNRIVVLAVGKSNIQIARSKAPFSMGHDILFEKHTDVFKSGFIEEIDDVKYRRIPMNKGGYIDKLLVADKAKKVYTLEYDSAKSSFGNRREIRSMEKVMGDDGLWAFYVSFVGENPEYTPADFMYYNNTSNICYTASDSIMTQDETHTDKNNMGFSHVNCIEPYGVYTPDYKHTESLLFAAKIKGYQRHRIYLQYAGFNTDVDDTIGNNPDADIYNIVALPANDRDVSFICALGDDGANHNVLFSGVVPNNYDAYKKKGMVRELSPIYSGVSAAFPCQASDDILTGFIVLDDGTLVRFIYSLPDDSLITRPVEIEVDNKDSKIRTFNCYHTQLNLATVDGIPLPSGNITITSPYTCLFEIMGKRYAVKENHPLEITDVMSPTLYISQYADEIYASEFGVEYHTKNIDGKELSISCTINPSADYEAKISSMSSDSWCNAKKQDGSYLIPNDYRSSKNMEALNAAISKITTATGCSTINVCNSVSMRKLSATNITEFALSFDKNQITYTESNINQLYLTLKAECHDGSHLIDIFGWGKKKLSSIIKAVSKNIVEITKVIVAKVDKAIHTVVEFIKDNVHYIIEEILDFVSKAYDTITAIFTRISVYFQDFMEWLGQLLHWNEIKENAVLIKNTFYKYFDLWQNNVCNGISTIQSGIDKLTDYLQLGLTSIDNKYGNVTLGDILSKIDENSTNKKIEQDMDDAISNNIFMEKLLCGAMSENTVVKQDNINDIVKKIVQSAEKAISGISEQTQKFIECFKTTDILEVKLNVFVEYFKNIANIPTQMTNDLLDIVKDLILNIFQTIKNCLEAKINIPFFSWLFSEISDMECNIINIISLIIAVPYSAVDKILGKGKTLTENNDDISLTEEKVIAGICAVFLPIQKAIDEAYTAVSITGLQFPVFRRLNGALAIFSDTVSVVAWTIMIIGKTSEDKLKTASSICFCCSAFLISLIDCSSLLINANVVNALLATAGGGITIALGIASCTCFAISNGGLHWKDNVSYDSASIVASGVGSISSLFFIKPLTDPASAIVIAIGFGLKKFFNIASVATCWFSTGLTFSKKNNEYNNEQLVFQIG